MPKYGLAVSSLAEERQCGLKNGSLGDLGNALAAELWVTSPLPSRRSWAGRLTPGIQKRAAAGLQRRVCRNTGGIAPSDGHFRVKNRVLKSMGF